MDREIITSSRKKQPYVLWLIFSTVLVLGSFIFLSSLKQIKVPSRPKDTPVTVNAGLPFDAREFPPAAIHFPQPRTYSRDECAGNPVHNFAILSMQRSGSGWFETLLNSHPNISSNGEIFSVKHRKSNFSTIRRNLDSVYSLEWLSSAAKNSCTGAVGFKWMLNQAVMDYHQDIANYFNSEKVSVIFVFRRNLLRRLVSVLANAYDRKAKLINGTHKAHVHTREEAEVLARYKPTLNINFLIQDLTKAENMMAESLNYFKSCRHLVLYYEDLIGNPKLLADAQEFLGVPLRKLESHHVKIHTKPLSEQINNWEDVCKTLRGSIYWPFLDDSDYWSREKTWEV